LKLNLVIFLYHHIPQTSSQEAPPNPMSREAGSSLQKPEKAFLALRKNTPGRVS
jgi:hypothetical protein